MSLEVQKELESTYVMHTFGRKPVCLVEGKGMKVLDDKGAEYIDCIAGIGADSLGHCHPVVVDAISQQAARLIHVSNYYYIEGRGELSKQLSDLLNEPALAAGENPEAWQTFYANSGAEANECAIKLARLWGKQHGLGQTVVVLKGSFHGRTLATLAATAQPVKQEAFQPLPGGFVATERDDVAALEQLFADLGTEICAVMLEPIQGESGVHPCSQEFMDAVRRLTKAQDACMVCDEVQCGIFRCGTHPFGFQHYGIVPDIVAMAKGIASGFPMGACAARAEVAATFEPGLHGSTFGGSNLAIAAARATLTELSQGGYAQSVTEVGDYFQAKLAELPAVVSTRGLGLMVAAELAEGVNAPDVVSKGLEAGMLLNATGPTTLRFLLPLIATKADVDEIIEKLGELC